MMPTALYLKAIHRIGVVAVAALMVAACGGGGGSGGGNTKNSSPPKTTNTSASFTYSGPAPASVDVQRFQQSFYNNLVNDNRCGSCHTRGGAGRTAFVDRNDVNFAYSEALSLVNRENPSTSSVVEKVYGGHNCWEASNAACRVQMISYIEGWLNGDGISATSVKLIAPIDRDPNGSGSGFKSYPATATLFSGSTLYSTVQTHCAGCHSETSAVKQQPYFASPDPLVAYEAIKSKIDLNDPALSNLTLRSKSRLVVRLRDEFHNCWSTSCANDAVAMSTAIQQFADQIPSIQLSATAYRSKAQVLNDGVVGVSGGRFELYQIALWRFLEGEGKVVSDTSGVSPAISLTIKGTEGDTGDFKWIGGGGIQFNGAVAYGSASTSRKLYDLLSAAGEYTVEAWTIPSNVADENREIVAYGNGTDRRNFMLGQTMYNYDFYNRSSDTNVLGMVGNETFSSDPEQEALQANLQHVVVTYDAVNGRRVYVDDELVSENYPDDKGTLANDWDKTYAVVMGNTLSQAAATTWKGALRMVAIHKRALSPTQIAQNAAVRPGEKRYVMFNVSKIENMPASCYNAATDTSYCYVYFEMSQYDNYAYLFNKPHFISLNSDLSDLDGLKIKGMRIGINGKLSAVGQAFTSVNATIDPASSDYRLGDNPGSGQRLSDVGTVVPKLAGADVDLLYLEFDKIGSDSATDRKPPPTVLAFDYVLSGVAAINLGWRTFDELNASFAQMTTITNPNAMTGGATPVRVSDVFNGVRSQLPAVEDFPAYLASHQTSVTKLAIAYCSALMHDDAKRNAFFSTASPGDLAGSGWNNLVNPLVSKFLGNSSLYNAPAKTPPSISIATPMRTELLELLTHSPSDTSRKAGLCASGCGTDAAILNAATVTCAAALANAALTMQ